MYLMHFNIDCSKIYLMFLFLLTFSPKQSLWHKIPFSEKNSEEYNFFLVAQGMHQRIYGPLLIYLKSAMANLLDKLSKI